jgi:hypothetical protein
MSIKTICCMINFLVLWNLIVIPIGCKYTQTSPWDYFTKGMWILLVLFHFIKWIFFEWNLLQLVIKIHIIAPIDHMFYVNHYWINMNFSKCVDFNTCLLNLGYLNSQTTWWMGGGCKIGWLTFCIVIQSFAKWHAFTCY